MYEGNNEGGEDSEGPGEKGVGLTVLVHLGLTTPPLLPSHDHRLVLHEVYETCGKFHF